MDRVIRIECSKKCKKTHQPSLKYRKNPRLKEQSPKRALDPLSTRISRTNKWTWLAFKTFLCSNSRLLKPWRDKKNFWPNKWHRLELIHLNYLVWLRETPKIMLLTLPRWNNKSCNRTKSILKFSINKFNWSNRRQSTRSCHHHIMLQPYHPWILPHIRFSIINKIRIMPMQYSKYSNLNQISTTSINNWWNKIEN